MKISVLIPTYRYARYLPEAIESVLAQDIADFELLISDDASPDGSADIIRSYAARDPRIRFRIHERNLGMVENWNWCLREARGDYVKFVFGDDRLVTADALRRMAAMLDADPGVALAATARAILDDDSRFVEIWDDIGGPPRMDGAAIFGRCLTTNRNLIGEPSAVMFRRKDGSRGFDPRWRQFVDMEMWFHLLQSGKLAYDPAPLCAFRRHPAQQTVFNQKNGIASTECMEIIARYFDCFAGFVGVHEHPFAVRQSIFRYVYYTRKEADRSPEAEAAAARLKERLTPPWFAACWIAHRTTKPFRNLGHFWRKYIVRRAAKATDPALLAAARRAAIPLVPPAGAAR